MANARRRGIVSLLIALALAVAALALLVVHTSSPTTVSQATPATLTPRAALVDVSADAALLDPVSGPDRMVGPDGTTRWVADGARRGALACLVCPAALRSGARPARIDGGGTLTDATDLAGRLEVQGTFVRADGDALSVWIPTATGHIDVGRISAQSLDARRYAVAPAVAISPDRRSATAVIGLDDTREVGRARVALLRVGRPAVERVVDLARAGRAPAPCRPAPGSDRWGWVDGDASGGPGVGTATFRAAVGDRLGPVRRLRHPYGSCTVTEAGYVLVTTSSTPEGTRSAVAWLDRTGATVREITRTGTDPRAFTSVATSGAVVVPVDHGFELDGPDIDPRPVAAQDAALAPSGELWVVRDGRARVVTGG